MSDYSKVLELAATNTRSGPHDFYNLFAHLPVVNPTEYGVSIAWALDHRTDASHLHLSCEPPTEIKIIAAQQRKDSTARVESINAIFGRQFTERAAKDGAKFRLVDDRGRTLEFSVPASAFSALLEASDEIDRAHLIEQSEKERRQRREHFVAEHPELSQSVKQSILDGTIHLGMADKEVRASWGNPDRINETVNSLGKSEQWVYGDSQFVYFENGLLTSWQNSK